jgi:hypothetical protein
MSVSMQFDECVYLGTQNDAQPAGGGRAASRPAAGRPGRAGRAWRQSSSHGARICR